MADPSKQLVVLSDWQQRLRSTMTETETERKAILKQYDEATEQCGDQSARDARYATRNQQLNDIRVRIIDAIDKALDKNNAKTVEDQDILNAKEHLAYTFFCSDLFSEAEEIYREVLLVRVRTNTTVQPVTLTRHMLLATLHHRADAGLSDGDPDIVRREALKLAVANINYTTEENRKLDEDVDLALDLLKKLPQHNSDDKTMMAIVLRKKIELLDEYIRQGTGANARDKIQLILADAKWRLFNLLKDGLRATDEARNVAISLEPDLRDASGNSTLLDPKTRQRLGGLLSEVSKFLADTDVTATGTETPTDETPPSGGMKRTDTWRSNPVYYEEDEEAALFDAGEKDRDENPAYSRRWMRSFIAFRCRTLLDAAVSSRDRTSPRVRVAIIDTGIDPENWYINTYRRWEPSYKIGGTLHERYRDFSNIQPPPATVKTKGGEAEAPSPDQTQAQVPTQPEDQDGHGTFIAGIFLQLVPDIDLRVARIGVKRSKIQTDTNLSFKIAQAVKHAAETWKSEIISISFSCKKTTDIKEAIEYALSKQILIFAATGNTGYNNDLIYPAAEDKVFKVRACDHNGEKARYAAPAADKRYTLLTLGSAVESTWPPSLRAEAADNGLEVKCPRPDVRDNPVYPKQHPRDGKCDCNDTWTVMSGTSFAAPVAASFAAVVYQFWNKHQNQFRLNEGTEPFKSIHSMRLVLKAMARTTELYPNDRVYILPPIGHQGSGSFKFLPKATNNNLNQQDQNYNEFFIDALQRAINQGDGS